MTNRTQPHQPQYTQRARTAAHVPAPTGQNPSQQSYTQSSRPNIIPNPRAGSSRSQMVRAQTQVLQTDSRYVYTAHPQASQFNRPPKREPDRRPLLILGGFALAGVGIVALLFGLLVLIAVTPERIRSGVTVGGVDVGGARVDEVPALLSRGLPSQTITLVDGVRRFPLTALEMGIGIDIDRTLDRARVAASNESVTPVYTINLTAAQNALIARSNEINIPAIPGRDGRVMDIPAMLERLMVDLEGEIADGVFELEMIVVAAPRETSANRGGTTTHVVEAGQELALIARQYGVTTQEIVDLNGIANPDLIFVGQQLTIPAAGVYIPENIPPAPVNSGRSIVVSTGEQRIYAYENGELVRTHLVSTGTSATPTVLGDYRIYVKHVRTNMRGPGYFMPDVPYTMYFYQGYGIHGTYWHNSFGRPMSHGCVNLPVAEAEWFYNFASVGTLVRVI